MPDKKHERYIAKRFLEYWNKKNKSDFIIDEQFLASRRDNENPDIKIVSRSNPQSIIDLEITHAEDSSLVEAVTRTWEKICGDIKVIIDELIPDGQKRFSIRIHGDYVRRKSLVRKDLVKLRNDIYKFLGSSISGSELEKLGYRVITGIQHEGSGSPLFMLVSETKNGTSKYLYENSGYFERLESCLEREKLDLLKKGRLDSPNTILVIEIDGTLGDEVHYTPIREEEVDDYTDFVYKYRRSFKNIFVADMASHGRVYNLEEVGNEIYNILF